MWEKVAPTHTSRDTAHVMMSELITQEWIFVGSSNLVEGLTTRPAMYDR